MKIWAFAPATRSFQFLIGSDNNCIIAPFRISVKVVWQKKPEKSVDLRFSICWKTNKEAISQKHLKSAVDRPTFLTENRLFACFLRQNPGIFQPDCLLGIVKNPIKKPFPADRVSVFDRPTFFRKTEVMLSSRLPRYLPFSRNVTLLLHFRFPSCNFPGK